MRVIITEQQFKDFLRLSILGKSSIVLNENQESKSIDAATKLLMNKFGWDKDKANDFIRFKLRDIISNLKTKRGGKFILGVTRMYVDGELNNTQAISQLNTIMGFIVNDSNLYEEYDRSLNGESLQTLVDRFSQAIAEKLEQDKKDLASKEYSNKANYKIVRIDSFEEASKYNQYTPWCVTHDEDAFNTYTKEGICQFYFLLRNGFENEPEIKGENCPLDSYGLSMVAVCVDENGGLSSCTTRWNDKNGGTMNAMTTQQISELIGRNFYDVFKPNNKWEETLQNATARLKNGESPQTIFDIVGKFINGYARIILKDKWNFIDKQGNILSKQWFDAAGSFQDGCASIKLNNKWNFINNNGNYLFKQWFDYVFDFCEGFAVVELNKKYNWIDTKGKFLSKQWFDRTYNFHNGYARVKISDKWNCIDTKGKILSKQWFDDISSFLDGFARVKLNDKFNFIDADGNYMSKQWFDYVSDIANGFAWVILNGHQGIFDMHANISSIKWVD